MRIRPKLAQLIINLAMQLMSFVFSRLRRKMDEVNQKEFNNWIHGRGLGGYQPAGYLSFDHMMST